MTDKEINQRIAIYCGIKKDAVGWWIDAATKLSMSHPPNYFGDLNAVYDAETKLDDNAYESYWNALVCACVSKNIERMNSSPAWLRASVLAEIIKNIS